MLNAANEPAGALTLDPLPPILQRGLKAIAALGFLSFFASIGLFFYLTYKFIVWRIRGQVNNFNNQFLILLYNLVFSDIQQSFCFLLNARWLAENKIHAGTPICWIQGWFDSTGDLASSVWIFAIGLHTFAAVILDYKLPFRVFLYIMACLWAFIYGMAIIGVITHPSDLYTRAGAWCWINQKYENERLWLHYIWIFFCMFGTIITYSTMFYILRRRVLAARALRATNITNTAVPKTADAEATAKAARYMIIYPAVYVLCTLPLGAGRAAAMAGHQIPYSYYCLAGATITSNGWLDVILYALTRHALVFSDSPGHINEADLHTFGFYPTSKQWGITTHIEGGVLSKPTKNRDHEHARKINSRSGSMDDLFGNAIQGAVVTKTTVKVESSSVPSSDDDIALKTMKRRGSGKQDGDSESWFDDSLHKD